MAQMLEITGPPGVGKSSLYAALLRSQSSSDPWIPLGEARRAWALTQGTGAAWRRSLMRIGMLDRFFALSEQRQVGAHKRAVNRFFRERPELEALLLSTGQEKGLAPGGRLWIVQEYCRRIAEYQLVSDASGSPVLSHEGFWLLVALYDVFRGDSSQFAGALPLPAAVVALRAPEEVLVSRRMERSKRAPKHVGLSTLELADPDLARAELESMQVFYAACGRRGVPVLHQDTSGPMTSTLASVRAFLHECCDGFER